MASSQAIIDGPAQLRDLVWDMAAAKGALDEIATCWRRLSGTSPGLPLLLPIRLQETADLIEADVRTLAAAKPGQAVGPATAAVRRFAQFQRDITAAQALAREQRAGDTGDSALWKSVDKAMHRASGHLLSLIVQLAPVTGWSLGGPGEDPGQVVLQVTLG